MTKEVLFTTIGERYDDLKQALRKRRSDHRFSFCVVTGVLGEINEGRHDPAPMTSSLLE